MNSPFRNFLLSAVLIAVPAAGFTAVDLVLFPAPAQSTGTPGLGELSAYKSIVADTQSIAAGGDLVAAERRVTDLETLWDENAAALRKADRTAWTAVDTAADGVFAALRAGTPDAHQIKETLANLMAALSTPAPSAAPQPVQYIAGIAVTDETGHAIPCEEMIGRLRDALAGKTPSAALADLQSRALERCNADDDARADAFAAQALSQIKG